MVWACFWVSKLRQLFGSEPAIMIVALFGVVVVWCGVVV